MSETIWVIEDGEYSEYRVKGVYSSEENAKLAVAGGVTGEISEWPLDPAVEHWKAGRFLVRVDIDREGNSHVEHCKGDTSNGVSGPFTIGPYHDRFPSQKILRVYWWVKSDDEAVKIANEKRAKLIAAGEWT